MAILDTLKDRMKLQSFESVSIGTVWYYPITGTEQDKIGFGDAKKPMAAKLADVVILKTLDVNGGRVFQEADRKALMNEVSIEDISEIANGILDIDTVDEQLEK